MATSQISQDLDHADCFFAEALLRNGRFAQPTFMVVEYNRLFPPPIRFRERFSEGKAGRMGVAWMEGKREQHWSGCSMQAWHDLAAAHGYQLLQATLFDLNLGIKLSMLKRCGGIGSTLLGPIELVNVRAEAKDFHS